MVLHVLLKWLVYSSCTQLTERPSGAKTTFAALGLSQISLTREWGAHLSCVFCCCYCAGLICPAHPVMQ